MTYPLQRLLTWLSPAFPVGAFAFSGGLETAIAGGRVTDLETTRGWIAGTIRSGGPWSDAVLLAQAHSAASDKQRLAELSAFCLALNAAAERRAELLLTGSAFVRAADAWPGERPPLPASCPYPVAVGAIAGAHAVDRTQTLVAFLSAAVHAQVSVAVRLVPIGQTAGLEIVASLESLVADLAQAASMATLDEVGGTGYAADIAQMRHETLEPRIFRS